MLGAPMNVPRRLHLLAASGELQIQAFGRLIEQRGPRDEIYILWLSRAPVPDLAVELGADVIHIPYSRARGLVGEIKSRRAFSRAIKRLRMTKDEIVYYANGAQHFYGNYFARSLFGECVLIMDGMNTIVPRPVTARDRRNMAFKVLLGAVSGVPYRPYGGGDILGRRFFSISAASQEDLDRTSPSLGTDSDAVLIFDQGLFEIVGSREEIQLRETAEVVVRSRFSKILYRGHPRTGPLYNTVWLRDCGLIDVSNAPISEILSLHKPGTVLSFFSTALLEHPFLNRIAVLPTHLPVQSRDHIARLKTYFLNVGIEVIDA